MGLLDALALRDSPRLAAVTDHAAQLRQVAAIWPLALFAQLIACAVTLAAALIAERTPLIVITAIIAGAMVLASMFALVTLAVPPMRRWQAPVHVRFALVYSAVIGAALTALLWTASSLPIDRMQVAGYIAIIGALGLTAMALHSLRAVLFSFASAVALTVLILAGTTTGAVIALGCLACLALATRRLALLDLEQARRRQAEHGEGLLAARLIREFEVQGTGWFWQTDANGVLTYLSPKVAAAVAEPNASPLGRMLTTVFQMDTSAAGTERTLRFHLTSRTGFSDYPVRPALLGTIDSWWSMSGRPVTGDDGSYQGFIGTGADLTEKRRFDAEITKLALFDGLTGLANRARLRVFLDQTLAQKQGSYRPTTLFLLDLDRFKVVNDTLGHQVGDTLLVQVGQRLTRSIGDAGMVGRLGGDEFQVILPGHDNVEALSALARSVIASLSQPYTIEGTSISIGCSIGIAIAPRDGTDSETLIRNADLALYAAKGDGRGVHRFYRDELLHGAQNRKQLEDDLRQALVRDEFYLVYQPVVSTDTARIVGYEALLRWEHPTRGNISPAEFIPVAEDAALIEGIGEWVLRTACIDAAKWPGHVRVAVNVSPIQFANPSLPALVTNAIAKAGISASQLELEITEGVFLDETAKTDQMFKALKGIGVRLALDDFGTGYSSLGYLKTAPFDKIKIDQSFVRGAVMPGNRNAAIIKAIVALATTLEMETTAEGVELLDEIPLIRELGCSHIQGFVYGKPARADQVLDMLAESGGAATASGYKISRSQRTAMIRTAMLEVGEVRGEVRIRNISATGAMIDGIDFGRDAANVDLMVELLEGQMFPAKVRWNEDGKAGIEFNEHFNLERLTAATDALKARKAG